MARFRKKPVVVEAITFEELVAHGEACGAPLTDGMPWSFEYSGYPITQENNDCYLIPTLEGTMRFERGGMLITGVEGEIYPCKAGIFEQTYEPESVVRRVVVDAAGSKRFTVTTCGYERAVEADDWGTCDGALQLKLDGRIVAMFTDWQSFTTE